jgi:hypothetical protein
MVIHMISLIISSTTDPRTPYHTLAVPDLPMGLIGCIVIGLSHFCHNVLYFLNNLSAIFPYSVVLHFTILLNFKHPFIQID